MGDSTGRHELDPMIVEIELTLVSIIQGVALTMLIESAREIVAHHQQRIFWLYVGGGLFVIFVFWSRAVLHIVTVIRWPLEFGHNFLYIACALIEAIMFAQVTNPFQWFLWSAAFMAAGWLLFLYDLQLIHARMSDSPGAASAQLFAMVRRDQWLNIAALLPAVFLFNAAGACAIHRWPDYYLGRSGHIWLIALQLAGLIAYLVYAVRFFARMAPLISDARAEWRTERDAS